MKINIHDKVALQNLYTKVQGDVYNERKIALQVEIQHFNILYSVNPPFFAIVESFKYLAKSLN